MDYRGRPVLIVSLVILAIALSLVAWRAGVSLAQENQPASSVFAEDSAPAAPALEVVPGGPGFIALSAYAVRPWPNQSVPYEYSGSHLYNPDDRPHNYVAPVALPHGATIKKLVAYYLDNDVTKALSVQLARVPLDGTAGEFIASTTSSGAVLLYRAMQDTSITEPVVDNQAYTYHVDVSLPGGISVQFIGFRIDYAYPSALPLILK